MQKTDERIVCVGGNIYVYKYFNVLSKLHIARSILVSRMWNAWTPNKFFTSCSSVKTLFPPFSDLITNVISELFVNNLLITLWTFVNESRATPKAGKMELWNSGITERRKNKTKQNKNKQTNPTRRNHGTAEQRKIPQNTIRRNHRRLEILNDSVTENHSKS